MRPILDIRAAKVAVELASQCNLRCNMCPMSNLGRPHTLMEFGLVKKVAEDFAANGIRVRWLH